MKKMVTDSLQRASTGEPRRPAILLVEDEEVLRESLASLLEDEGFHVLQAPHGTAGLEIVLNQSVDLVVTDVRMPEMDGLALLQNIRKAAPETPVIVMTAYGTIDDAVSAMHAGAVDYLLKPVQIDDLVLKIRHALEFRDLQRQQAIMTRELADSSSFQNLVSDSPEMLELFELVKKVATVRSSVLIVGESGTGKELFARAIHYAGITRDKPFVAVNCGAIPESLIESELFGHRKGSFTGAIRDKTGVFEEASGGTIFLDEISNLPMHVQSTMLRVLEERVVVPVGDTKPRSIDVRVMAASNRNLESMVREETFRHDLLYRLNVVKLELPPLRHRKRDIPLLVHHFLERYMRELNRQVTGITNGAMRAMLAYDWPGNVRELRNVIERAVIFAEGRDIRVEDMPFQTTVADDEVSDDLKESLREFERQHILSSLRRNEYDKAATARQLGIGISSLYRKIDELDIPKNLEETTDISA